MEDGTTKEKFRTQPSWTPAKKVVMTERIVQEALAAVGLPTKYEGTHTIRRAVARHFFDSQAALGHDGALRVTSALLHHRSASATERYLGLTSERVRRDEVMRGKPFPEAAIDTRTSSNSRDGRSRAGVARDHPGGSASGACGTVVNVSEWLAAGCGSHGLTQSLSPVREAEGHNPLNLRCPQTRGGVSARPRLNFGNIVSPEDDTKHLGSASTQERGSAQPFRGGHVEFDARNTGAVWMVVLEHPRGVAAQ